MQLKILLQTALVAVSSLVFCNTPLQAQELPAPVSEEQEMLNQLPESVKAQMRPGIRYTIGSKTNRGWENGLLKGNAGLKHFYWSPVTSMVQASPSQTTKAQARSAAPMQQRHEFHYAKPIKAALPVNPAAVAPPPPLPKRAVARALPPSRNTRDVSAKLAYKRPRTSEGVNGELVSKDTEAKLYAAYPTSKSNQNASGVLTSKEAYGKLIRN